METTSTIGSQSSIDGVAEEDDRLTEYVATRWYRAPEVLFGASYHFPSTHNLLKITLVDCWAVGVILAEMILGRPIVPGKDHQHQVELTLDMLGSPPDDILDVIANQKVTNYCC
jgi:serine/threonine protein kinase